MNIDNSLLTIEHEVGIPLLNTRQSIQQVALSNHPCFAADEEGDIIGLNLCGLWLQKIPTSVLSLRSLRVLRLRANRLDSLPHEFRKLQNLEYLYLPENQFTTTPPVLSELSNLQTLALNRNLISDVDSSISKLKNLRKLGLSGNHLQAFPLALSELPHLSSLFIGANGIKSVPDWITNIHTVEELDISRNPIPILPRDLGKLKHLRRLWLRETLLTRLPDALFELSNLGFIDLNGVPITNLPKRVEHLSQLNILDLNGTHISTLPAELSRLQNLRSLNLSSLRMPEIPDVVFQLNQLQDLNLSGTRIRELPRGIGLLTELISLDLSSMGLLSVPPELFTLPKLRRLNLAGNRLREIPWQITQAHLEVFWRGHRLDDNGIFLAGNPLESPPPEIVNGGANAIKSYFESLKDKSKPIEEVKVLLVGEGGAGKTSIMKRLTGRDFDEHEPQTHGINIDEFSITAKSRRIKVHFWDFGGQEIMHATHQFFLSKRSAYILVLDGRKEEKTEYWLKHIETFGGDSPVLILLNKMDQHASFDVNRRFLSEKYPAIKQFICISCKDGNGIDQVQEALSKILSRVEHTRTTWASSWFNVKKRMEWMKEDFISYSQFRKICAEEGIADNVGQTTLVDFLHDLGIVLHFKDLQLKDTNVINPRWVTEGVYRIVNSKLIVDASGILRLELLQEILDLDTHPPEKHNFIIELMKKFELCYPLDRERVLLPGLLPVEEPKIRFPAEDIVRFIIGYDFFPKSIMPRFIVRMHDDIDGANRWRTGVVLSNTSLQTRAIIRVDEVERRIEISVAGEQRRDYLGIILHAFRIINQSFEKLDYHEKVPMPDAHNITVSYNHLVRLETKGIKNYMPDGSEKEYDVQELLGLIKPRKRTEEEILEILRELRERGDSEETLLEKANKSVLLQPNFFGVGFNLNELIRRIIHKSG